MSTSDEEMMFGELQTNPKRLVKNPFGDSDIIVHPFSPIDILASSKGRELEFDCIVLDATAWEEMILKLHLDTKRELGGFLLGAHFHATDEHRQQGLWISKSIPAEHEESTSVSLKFTHETWDALARRQTQTTPIQDLLGWYHSHPNWSVFLSSMDLFICNNYFPDPQHIAIVVDPIRNEFGVFQREPRGKYWRLRTEIYLSVAVDAKELRTRIPEWQQRWRQCTFG